MFCSVLDKLPVPLLRHEDVVWDLVHRWRCQHGQSESSCPEDGNDKQRALTAPRTLQTRHAMSPVCPATQIPMPSWPVVRWLNKIHPNILPNGGQGSSWVNDGQCLKLYVYKNALSLAIFLKEHVRLPLTMDAGSRSSLSDGLLVCSRCCFF